MAKKKKQIMITQAKQKQMVSEITNHAVKTATMLFLLAAHDPRCFVATKPTVLRDADGNYLRTTPYPKGFSPTMHGYKREHLAAVFLKAVERFYKDPENQRAFEEWLAKEQEGRAV